MKFYGAPQVLYLETDASGIGLSAGLLLIRESMNCTCDKTLNITILRPIAFASKSMSNAARHYSNIEREALKIFHGLWNIHHYCCKREPIIIINHKTIISIFKKEVMIILQ